MCEAVTMLDMPDTITETLTTAPVERSTTRVPVPVPAVATGKGNFGDFGDVVARMNLRNYHRSSRFFDSMFQNCIRFSISVGRTCVCARIIGSGLLSCHFAFLPSHFDENDIKVDLTLKTLV